MATHAQGGSIDPQLVAQLSQLAQQLTPQQLAWAGGFFTGLSTQPGTALPTAAANSDHLLTILYGSQTGHSREVAHELAQKTQASGIATEVVSMAKFKEKNLKKTKYLAIVVSTHGEGDPPDDAISLHAYLYSTKAPKLDGLQFCVLALGDSSYEFFCKTGKDFDARLEELGASRLLDRVDLDVDFDDGAEAWVETVSKEMKALIPASGGVAAPTSFGIGASATTHYSRKNPLKTRLLACQKITGRHSEKDIRHIEIDIEGSGLTYQPGDSLGVWFKNDAELVNDLLGLLEIEPETVVHINDEPRSIRDALIETYELTQLHPGFVAEYAERTNCETLKKIAAETEPLREYIDVRQIIDVVREHPAKVAAEDFIFLLRKLTPRLYSIASSQLEVEDEVHLTIGVVEYEAHGHYHLGGASGFLSHRLKEGEEVLVYVEPNDHFRLPANEDTPVIMIGPGTGIAPFRAFVQERAVRGAHGDNWLFFGNPHFTEDFLYQTDWQEFLESGVLTKLDVAFSRDQAEKVYVQHRIAENAAEIWEWIERGAHLYVCGDESRMAKDVHQALFEVVKHQGGLTDEETETYFEQLRNDHRYQRDVY